jgi:DNA replication protein DnaC
MDKTRPIEFKNRFPHLMNRCRVENCKNGYIVDSSIRPYQEVEEKAWTQCECLKKSVLFTRLYESNVPQEYYELSLEKDFDTKNSPDKLRAKMFVQNILNDLRSFYEDGSSLMMYGSAGAGKTMLSIEILKKAVSQKFSIYYDFFPSVVDAYKKKGYVADEEKARYAKIFSEVDFLVLDELGKEDAASDYNNRDFSTSIFLEINILKKRNLKPTMIITNMNGMPEIKQKYGQFVNSMMGHRFQTLLVNAEDFRLKTQSGQ